MNADEIVRALREAKELPIDAVLHAADLIESLQAQLAESQRREQAAVEDIKHLVFSCADDPIDLCGEVCANNDGICQRGVSTGFSDKCHGYEWRGLADERGEKG